MQPLCSQNHTRMIVTTDIGGSDTDCNTLVYDWQFYKEPSSYKGNLQFENQNAAVTRLLIPDDAKGKTIHVILKVSDNHSTPLCAYRRIILNVI